jgi:5,10-methylene-tetrahydrofolate dehydrogenase/methenyl tetrahydrofolate cyclohydrolase
MTISSNWDLPAAIGAGFITPVPGGVGPLTMALLTRHTLALPS